MKWIVSGTAILVFIVLLGFGFVQAAPAAAQGSVETNSAHLPPGKGKEEVLTHCTKCHDTSIIAKQRKTRDEWAQTLQIMAGRGMNANERQKKIILNYLSVHLGPTSARKRKSDHSRRALARQSGHY